MLQLPSSLWCPWDSDSEQPSIPGLGILSYLLKPGVQDHKKESALPPPHPVWSRTAGVLEGYGWYNRLLFWALAPSAVIGQWFRTHGRKNYSVGFCSPRRAALQRSGASPGSPSLSPSFSNLGGLGGRHGSSTDL